MGLFDFFKRDRGEQSDEDKYVDKKVTSLGKKAWDKRSQAYDREEAIRALIDIGTSEAATALLKRFKLQVDPSITDMEEKQLAFDGIVSIGRGERGKRLSDVGKDAKEISTDPLTAAEVAELTSAVVDSTRAYCNRAANLTWPLKVLRELLDDEPYQKELLDMLSGFDTEYTRNVEPKVNLLAAMETIKSEPIRKAVEEYLDDVNETVRFHAVQTTFEQGDQASLPALVALMKNEESVRIKNKVCDGIATKGWVIGDDLIDDFRAAMSDVYEYELTSKHKVKKA